MATKKFEVMRPLDGDRLYAVGDIRLLDEIDAAPLVGMGCLRETDAPLPRTRDDLALDLEEATAQIATLTADRDAEKARADDLAAQIATLTADRDAEKAPADPAAPGPTPRKRG